MEQRLDQRVLGAEVVVDRGQVDARGRGQQPHRGGLEAVLHEQLLGHVEDAGAGLVLRLDRAQGHGGFDGAGLEERFKRTFECYGAGPRRRQAVRGPDVRGLRDERQAFSSVWCSRRCCGCSSLSARWSTSRSGAPGAKPRWASACPRGIPFLPGLFGAIAMFLTLPTVARWLGWQPGCVGHRAAAAAAGARRVLPGLDPAAAVRARVGAKATRIAGFPMARRSHNSAPTQPLSGTEWRAFGLLLPYLLEYKWRVAAALAFLAAAKVANVGGAAGDEGGGRRAGREDRDRRRARRAAGDLRPAALFHHPVRRAARRGLRARHPARDPPRGAGGLSPPAPALAALSPRAPDRRHDARHRARHARHLDPAVVPAVLDHPGDPRVHAGRRRCC